MRLSQTNKDDLAALTKDQLTRIVFGDVPANLPFPSVLPQGQALQSAAHADCPAVAALLLGGSPVVMDCRVRAAAELYRKGLVPTIIPTGGVRHPDKGCEETEAEYMARTLGVLGVPNEAILLENEATTTRENMIFGTAVIERVLHPRGAFTVYVVTSAFHLRRSLALARLYLPRTARILGCAAADPGGGPDEWPGSEYYTGRVHTELGLLKGLVDNGETDDIEFQP